MQVARRWVDLGLFAQQITPSSPIMKVLFSLAFTFFAFSALLSAQFIPNAGLHGYLNDRVVATEINGDQLQLEGRSGWHVGPDFRIGKKVLYVQPGVHYYSTNTRVTDLREVGLPRDLGSQNHVALKIPLQAGLRLGLNGTAAVHLQGGPVATTSIKEKLVSDLGGQRDLTIGMQAGAAVDLLRFNLYARYEWGLTDAWESTPGTADVLSVGVGLVF